MPWTQKGTDIDPEVIGDLFNSVSLSSDGLTVALGCFYTSDPNNRLTYVKVYSWNGSSWIQKGTNIYGEAPVDYFGYSLSLSSDGLTLAIGAWRGDGNGLNDCGTVRVFSWNGSSWIQKGTTIYGDAASAYSGYSVSLSSNGSILAIGYSSNKVKVYSWNGSSWIQNGTTIYGEVTGDGFGKSISLSSDGTTVAIGATLNNGNGLNDCGSVRVYSWNGSVWTQKGADIDGKASLDQSGYSVSLSSDGSTVAIGAPYNDDNGSNSGHVRVYYWNGSSWIQKGLDIKGVAAGDQSGYSISLSSDGSILAIGAPYNDNSVLSSDRGHVKVYYWNESSSSWMQQGSDINGEIYKTMFGQSVSLISYGSTYTVGIAGNNFVRVYTFTKLQPTISNFSIPEKLSGDPPFNINDPSSNSTGAFSYTSNNSSVATISGKAITITGSGTSVITATQASTVYYESGTITATFISNVCFPAGTFIKLDQGILVIEKINPDIHTIDGKKIVGVTRTISTRDFLVCFEKDSLGKNIPSHKTLITPCHEIFYNGKMKQAVEFVNDCENIYKVKYRGEILYNVLLEEHYKILANNMICESLNPENPIAKLYNLLKTYSSEEQYRLVKEYNEYTLNNNKFNEKQLKILNKCFHK